MNRDQLLRRGRCKVVDCQRNPTPGHGISVCGEHEREWDAAWKGYDWAKVPLADKQTAWARFLRREPIHA
jgi:hypothetical protein